MHFEWNFCAYQFHVLFSFLATYSCYFYHRAGSKDWVTSIKFEFKLPKTAADGQEYSQNMHRITIVQEQTFERQLTSRFAAWNDRERLSRPSASRRRSKFLCRAFSPVVVTSENLRTVIDSWSVVAVLPTNDSHANAIITLQEEAPAISVRCFFYNKIRQREKSRQTAPRGCQTYS